MTFDEFQEWFAYHSAAFSGVLSWLAKFPAKSSDPLRPSQPDILQAWYRQLKGLDLTSAKAASDTLAAQPDDQQPRAADRHPAAILSIAKRARAARGTEAWRPRIVDGHETFNCLVCHDTGAVIIWAHRSMVAARDGKLGQPFTLYTECVRCNCEASEACRWMPLAFDARCMVPIEPILTLQEQMPRLLEFVAGAVPRGYADFAEFATADRTEDF